LTASRLERNRWRSVTARHASSSNRCRWVTYTKHTVGVVWPGHASLHRSEVETTEHGEAPSVRLSRHRLGAGLARDSDRSSRVAWAAATEASGPFPRAVVR
jgi:hypothetical protein